MKSTTVTPLQQACVVLLAAVSLQTFSQAGSHAAAPEMRLEVRRLDLSRPDVAARVYARIESSARLLCRGSIAAWDVSRVATLKRCIATAIDDAVKQARTPALTTLHLARQQGSAPATPLQATRKMEGS